ncbi:hypothetical protein AOQ84DRAFT_155602 [Glonium stellatum]|uniref:Uncharacterized protein n=1 Tax=Glonium stellatum TaxID=574774 RepID=A0A8E2ER15_9PEZI|nr:hypothetical protein AOQ84DRAFT_155602 [Glonium stellatum]
MLSASPLPSPSLSSPLPSLLSYLTTLHHTTHHHYYPCSYYPCYYCYYCCCYYCCCYRYYCYIPCTSFFPCYIFSLYMLPGRGAESARLPLHKITPVFPLSRNRVLPLILFLSFFPPICVQSCCCDSCSRRIRLCGGVRLLPICCVAGGRRLAVVCCVWGLS